MTADLFLGYSGTMILTWDEPSTYLMASWYYYQHQHTLLGFCGLEVSRRADSWSKVNIWQDTHIRHHDMTAALFHGSFGTMNQPWDEPSTSWHHENRAHFWWYPFYVKCLWGLTATKISPISTLVRYVIGFGKTDYNSVFIHVDHGIVCKICHKCSALLLILCLLYFTFFRPQQMLLCLSKWIYAWSSLFKLIHSCHGVWWVIEMRHRHFSLYYATASCYSTPFSPHNWSVYVKTDHRWVFITFQSLLPSSMPWCMVCHWNMS